MVKFSFLYPYMTEIFALLELAPLPISCKNHFGISHNALDRLSTSKIVQVSVGSLICTPSVSLYSKCVFMLTMCCAIVNTLYH